MARPLLQQQLPLAFGGDAPCTRNDTLARYLRLREISKTLHDRVLKFMSGDVLLNHARRLGLAQGRTLLLEHKHEIYYIYDLAIYTAPPDRSRAIDRYARSHRFEHNSDEQLMLDAMCGSQFAILRIERRHDAVGLIATDLLRKSEVWLVDIGLESSMGDGQLIATRLFTPGPFSMAAGAHVPLGIEMLQPICASLPGYLANSEPSRLAEDRRFAETVYKAGLASGLVSRMTYLDPPDRA